MLTTRTTPPLLIAGALGLGLAADGLIRAPLWGLNVTLGIAFLVAWGIQVRRLAGGDAVAGSAWAWLGATGFAAMWALRDEPTLLGFDLLAALGLLTLPLLAARGVSLRAAGVLDLLQSPFRAGWEAVVGGARALFAELPWSGALGRRRGLVQGTLVGVVVAVPIVAVFGALFASADPTFEAAAESLFDWGLGTAVGHVALTCAGAWVSAGYLRALLADRQQSWPAVPRIVLGLPPVVIALGAMVVVFTLFVGTQAGNLFRGEAWVREQLGVTFAEYARRGFFELVTASVLALPIVYGATFAAGRVAEGAVRSLRALQGVALGLVAAVALSALWRMGLYVEAYGLTEDRLYGSAIILWIAGSIGVLARSILVGRTVGVARGIVVTAAVVLGLLNAVSPVSLIARVNLGRRGEAGPDLVHIASLGADAVPAISRRLPSLSPVQQCYLAGHLVERLGTEPDGDWRGWNLARSRALALVPELVRVAAACPPAPATPAP